MSVSGKTLVSQVRPFSLSRCALSWTEGLYDRLPRDPTVDRVHDVGCPTNPTICVRALYLACPPDQATSLDIEYYNNIVMIIFTTKGLSTKASLDCTCI